MSITETQIKEAISLLRTIKELEERKEELRQSFFKAVEEEKREEILAQIPVHVEKEFLKESGLKPFEFIYLHYPTWTIIHHEDRGDIWSFVLEENPYFMSKTYLCPEMGFKLTKEIRTPEPKIDFELMQRLEPDLYKEIVVEREVKTVHRTVDEESLAGLVVNDPDAFHRFKMYYVLPGNPTLAMSHRKLSSKDKT